MTQRTDQSRSTDEHYRELTRRSGVDSALGTASAMLEQAVTLIEKLALDGFTYTDGKTGDTLGYVRKLSDQVLDLQVHIRTDNRR